MTERIERIDPAVLERAQQLEVARLQKPILEDVHLLNFVLAGLAFGVYALLAVLR